MVGRPAATAGRPRTRDSCSRTRSCPTNSSSRRGRSAASTACSSGSGVPSTMRWRSSDDARVMRGSTSSARPEQGGDVGALGNSVSIDIRPRVAGVSTAVSASLFDQPRPSKAPRTCSRQADSTPSDAGTAAGAREPSPVGAPSRSLSSSTMRCAPLRPIPGTRVRAARSSPATACRRASGECTASMAWASRGPTPLAVCRSSNTVFSSSSRNPYSVSESSRTTSDVGS